MSQISGSGLRSFKANFNVRPLKFAYFFPEDDSQTFEHVVRYLSTQWGAIRNFLVPVPQEMQVWPSFQQFLELHQPDRFVGYFPNGSDIAPLQDQLQRIFPAINVDLMNGKQWERFDRAAHPLWLLPSQSDRTENEQTLVVHSFETEDDVERRLLLTLFGAIYSGQEEQYAKAFQIRNAPCNFRSKNIWQHQTDRKTFGSVINLTGYGVRTRQVASPEGGLDFHLLITDRIPDLCFYWNYRAEREATDFLSEANRRTILLPTSQCANGELVDGLCNLIRDAPVNPNASSDVDLLITCFDDVARQHLERQLRQTAGVEVLASARLGTSHWAGRAYALISGRKC